MRGKTVIIWKKRNTLAATVKTSLAWKLFNKFWKEYHESFRFILLLDLTSSMQNFGSGKHMQKAPPMIMYVPVTSMYARDISLP